MQRSSSNDEGFSLIELLIVVVVLGIIAAVTVFAIRGLTDEADTNACATDLHDVTTGMESLKALTGSYSGGEAALESEGVLRTQSALHDVTLTGNTFTVVPVGACVVSPTTAPSPTSTSIP